MDGKELCQLIAPESVRHIVLKGLHDELGHMGRDRTISLLRERVFWPKMYAEVDEYVKQCPRCLMRKSSDNVKVP